MLLILTYRVCVHQGYLHIHRLMCRAGWRCKAHNLARPLHPSLPLQWYCGPMQLHTFVRCAEQQKGGREVWARPISSRRPGQKLARMPSGLTSPLLLYGWERWDAEHPARCYIGQSNMVSQITIIYKISFSPILWACLYYSPTGILTKNLMGSIFIFYHWISVVYRYNRYVFPGTSPTKEMTFDAHYKMYVRLFKKGNMRQRKVTHLHRHTAVTKLQQAGAQDADIQALALWVHDDQHSVYQKLVKPDVLAKEAGFLGQTSYYLWRGQLQPEKFSREMWSAVFPEADARLERMCQVRFDIHCCLVNIYTLLTI